MLLNRLEFVLMNNPVRALIQRHLEARRLLHLGGRMNGGSALEIGCGRGVGLEIVLDWFGADAVHGFDLDPRMIARASRRLAGRRTTHRLWVADAARMPSPDATYDAVFNFGVLHHLPEWRAGVAEVARILKPGGRLYGEEVLAGFLERRIVRRLFDHPRHDRFDGPALSAALEAGGLALRAWRQWRNQFAWFVAEKPSSRPHADRERTG